MPLFEYKCPQCRHGFEQLIRGRERVRCPACGSEEPEKLLSAAAAHVGDRTLPVTSDCPPPEAPPCGPGCCRLP